MQIIPLSENPWYQKVLKEITETDRRKREMEKNFHSDMIDDYQQLVEEEAKQAVELLKYGVGCQVSKGAVLITVDDETTFEIQKEALRNELGVDQYNLLVNNITEDNDSDKDETEKETDESDDSAKMSPSPSFESGQSQTVKLPDGSRVPAYLAPMLIFQQAMNQAMSIYTGQDPRYQQTGTGLQISRGKKEHSKSTSELLKNIADLQQQVLLIEDEKNAAQEGNKREVEDLKIEKAETEAKQRETMAKIGALQSRITELNKKCEAQIQAAKDEVKKASEEARAKEEELERISISMSEKDALAEQTKNSLADTEKELAEAKESLSARQKELEEVKNNAEQEKKKLLEDAENLRAEITESVEKARQEAASDVTRTKDSEIASLKSRHSDEISEINSRHAKEIESLNSKHASEVNDLNIRHAKETESLKQSAKEAAAKARAEGEKESGTVKNLEQQVRNAEDSLEKEKANSQKAWDRYNKAKEDIARLRKELDDAKKKISEAAEQLDNLKDANDTLSEAAYKDQLTGVKTTIAMNEELPDKDPASLVVIRTGISGMKAINDNGGISLGNQTIEAVASALSDKFGAENVYRTMGDQFVVCTKNPDKANSLIADVRNALKSKYNVNIIYGVASRGTNNAESVTDIFSAAVQIMQNMKTGSSTHSPAPAKNLQESMEDISVDEDPSDDGDYADDDLLMKTLAEGQSL